MRLPQLRCSDRVRSTTVEVGRVLCDADLEAFSEGQENFFEGGELDVLSVVFDAGNGGLFGFDLAGELFLSEPSLFTGRSEHDAYLELLIAFVIVFGKFWVSFLSPLDVFTMTDHKLFSLFL